MSGVRDVLRQGRDPLLNLSVENCHPSDRSPSTRGIPFMKIYVHIERH
jgi:hypothetical protein